MIHLQACLWVLRLQRVAQASGGYTGRVPCPLVCHGRLLSGDCVLERKDPFHGPGAGVSLGQRLLLSFADERPLVTKTVQEMRLGQGHHPGLVSLFSCSSSPY